MKKSRIKLAVSPKPPQHGTRSTYVHGCRCEPCTGANNKWCREYQALLRSGKTRVK